MRKLILFFVMLTISIVGFAQNNEPETSSPTINKEIVRKCAILDVEGTNYEDVTVTFKPSIYPTVWDNIYKVKVTVTDSSGTTVWGKTFKNTFLYVFSDGQIQIGKPKFRQIIVSKSSTSGDWIGIVREKEGVY